MSGPSPFQELSINCDSVLVGEGQHPFGVGFEQIALATGPNPFELLSGSEPGSKETPGGLLLWPRTDRTRPGHWSCCRCVVDPVGWPRFTEPRSLSEPTPFPIVDLDRWHWDSVVLFFSLLQVRRAVEVSWLCPGCVGQ
jgi:hypothetical protein